MLHREELSFARKRWYHVLAARMPLSQLSSNESAMGKLAACGLGLVHFGRRELVQRDPEMCKQIKQHPFDSPCLQHQSSPQTRVLFFERLRLLDWRIQSTTPRTPQAGVNQGVTGKNVVPAIPHTAPTRILKSQFSYSIPARKDAA